MVVPLTRGQRAHELVSAHHPHTKWKTYPMGHEVCMLQIHAIRDGYRPWFNLNPQPATARPDLTRACEARLCWFVLG